MSSAGRKTGVGSESRRARLQLAYGCGKVWRGMIGLVRPGNAALSNTAVGLPCGPGLMMTGQAATQAFERAVRPCGVSEFRPDHGTRSPRSPSWLPALSAVARCVLPSLDGNGQAHATPRRSSRGWHRVCVCPRRTLPRGCRRGGVWGPFRPVGAAPGAPRRYRRPAATRRSPPAGPHP